MTVKVRPYRRGGWEVDIMLTFPGRDPVRERRKAPVGTKSAAKRWGEERERQLIQRYTSTDPNEEVARPDISKKEVPTLAAFFPRYIEGHCKANRLRPSTMYEMNIVFNTHIIPAFGKVRLDRITPEQIQRFKAERAHLKSSTVNKMLTLLRGMLNIAVEWEVIDKVPTKIKPLKESLPAFQFYDAEELDRLVLAAEKSIHPNAVLAVLLGGEAGLRCGEMLGLRWADIDFKRDILTVERQVWKRHEGLPKGNRSRTIPLADRLRAALAERRHLQSPYVLLTSIGTQPCAHTVRYWLNSAQRLAGFEPTGPHVLRHSFCSQLAMAGKPPRAIQELAGHKSIRTTERYMHLAPAAARDAIEALRRPPNWRHAGNGDFGVTKIH